MKRTANVVIIGRGIQGPSLAYHLTGLDLTDVCLVEMSTLGSGSSEWLAAIISRVFHIKNCLLLMQLSLAALIPCEEKLIDKHTMHRVFAWVKVGIRVAGIGPALSKWSMLRERPLP